MNNIKIAVGMSGGVDSSVSAYLLKEEGYDVIGITMLVIPDYVCKGKEKTEELLNDAKKVAKKIGIDHYVVDLREEFQDKVIDYFTDEYMAGRTPNPCVACNREIKFGDLFKAAEDLGADYVATGHYAIIEKDEELNRFVLKKSDDEKDQSYFLYNIKKENLSKTIMPLKNYSKEKVREVARKIDLDIAEKPDSEEICFIPYEDHGRFIEEDLNKEVETGDFIDTSGNVLGQHKGIIHYTVGQRKGLGVAIGRRVYVQEIIPEKNQVVLGDNSGLLKTKLFANQINLLAIDSLPEELRVTAKIRYGPKEANALIKPYKDGMIVEFEEPQRAITPGQSVVLYKGDIVIGGGIVEKVY